LRGILRARNDRQRGDLGPSAVDVAAGAIRCQFPPIGGVAVMQDDSPVGEQLRIAKLRSAAAVHTCHHLPSAPRGGRSRLPRRFQWPRLPPGELRQELTPSRWMRLEKGGLRDRQARPDRVLRFRVTRGDSREHRDGAKASDDYRSQRPRVDFERIGFV
jgi:hypothetical protein